MFPCRFHSITFFQKKKDIVIYQADDSLHPCILKCIITKEEAARQAFYDEYETFSRLSHPCIPRYYWLREDFPLPEGGGDCLALCMERCPGKSLPACGPLSLRRELEILRRVGEILSFLLREGVLYTDLNPSNLLLSEKENRLTLLDYTYCYYYRRNPHPEYDLRFSYDLTPSLKGEQLLIQELSLFFYDFHRLTQDGGQTALPSSLLYLLETGANPPEGLSMEAFLSMVRSCERELAGQGQTPLR